MGEGFIYDESPHLEVPERPALPPDQDRELQRLKGLLAEAAQTGEWEIFENIHQEFHRDAEYDAQVRAAMLLVDDPPPGIVVALRRDPVTWVRQLARRRFPW